MKSIELNFGKNLKYYLRVKDFEIELNCSDTLQKNQIISLLKLFDDVYIFDFETRKYIKA